MEDTLKTIARYTFAAICVLGSIAGYAVMGGA